jgi:hypothetical protein
MRFAWGWMVGGSRKRRKGDGVERRETLAEDGGGKGQ